MLCSTTTETLRTTETVQTWYSDVTYSILLWVPYVSTVWVLDDHSATPYRQNNHDANYNLRRTLLTLIRQYRYLTNTNLYLLMRNPCSPVFHFDWHYIVPTPLYSNLLLPLPLPTEDIINLLNLCLTSTYFQCNGKYYKMLHGTAMGWNVCKSFSKKVTVLKRVKFLPKPILETISYKTIVLSVSFGFHGPPLLTFKTNRLDLRGLDLEKMTSFTHQL